MVNFQPRAVCRIKIYAKLSLCMLYLLRRFRGIREDPIGKVLYNIKPLLNGFRGPRMALIDTVGFRGFFC